MAQAYGAANARTDEFGRARANAQEKARDFRSQLEETAEGALENVSKAANAVETRAESAYAATKQFVRDQPFVALAGVAALGLALGALWKLAPSRRSQSADVLDRLTDAIQPHYQALRRRW
jgi:ElaB/YqjD/DUF883 family membrane-anchored ribosome-binding protein